MAHEAGDLITVTLPGDLGKPRPAIVVQSDLIGGGRTVLVSPCTSARPATSFRLTTDPSPTNGLRQPSQVMIEKTTVVARDRCGPVFGRLDREAISSLNARLAYVLGLADD